MYAFERHEVGLPGMPKNGMPFTRANSVGLPRTAGSVVASLTAIAYCPPPPNVGISKLRSARRSRNVG